MSDFPPPFQEKILEWPDLLQRRTHWKHSSQTVVWTNGCFDILHTGHIRSLHAAKSFGDILVVGVNSDHSVKQIKGPKRPIVPDHERAQMLSALACVDYVVLFEETTPEVPLQRLQPEVHCKGAEYQPPNGKPIPEAKIIEACGGRIEFFPMFPDHSTSRVIERILSTGA